MWLHGAFFYVLVLRECGDSFSWTAGPIGQAVRFFFWLVGIFFAYIICYIFSVDNALSHVIILSSLNMEVDMLSWVHKEFTLWRIFWYCFAFFYLVPVAFAVMVLVVLWMFGFPFPVR